MAKKRQKNYKLRDAFIDVCYDIKPDIGDVNVEFMFSITKSNIRSVKDYDMIISKLVYPHLIEYDLLFNVENQSVEKKKVNRKEYNKRIINFKNKLTRYFPSCINGYRQAIMEGIIKSVTFYYPYVAVTQGQVGEVVYFFTIVEYSSGEQEFKISKTIGGNNDEFAAENISEYVHRSLFNKNVNICSNNQIYHIENSDTTNVNWIGMPISLAEIIQTYFGLDIEKMSPRVVVTTKGEIENYEQTKVKIIRKDNIALIAFNDSKKYHSHCCRSFKYLSEVEIIQKLLLSLKELINNSNINETEELRKKQYLEYLKGKSEKYKILLPESIDLQINEIGKEKKRSNVVDASIVFLSTVGNIVKN